MAKEILRVLEKSSTEFTEGSDMLIPIEHQQLVMERIREAKKNPETMLDWDEVSKKLLS